MPGANDDQQTRFLAKWDERLRGPNKSHRPITIGGPPGSPASVTKLADNMKDMDMINGRTFTRDAVLEHFGVPREIMGITQNSNRATADAAQYIYAKNVLTPKLKNRQDAINRQLLPRTARTWNGNLMTSFRMTRNSRKRWRWTVGTMDC